MKNTMIFLHGKGSYAEHPKYDIIREIAEIEKAELLTINAPFPHTNTQDPTIKGFRWHNLGRNNGKKSVQEQWTSYEKVYQYAYRNFGDNMKNLIWAGHSQGGALANFIALRRGAQKVISINSSLINPLCGYNIFKYTDFPRTDVPVLWIQGGKDDFPTEEDKSPDYLHWIGAKVFEYTSPNSTHDFFDRDILQFIKDTNIRIGNAK